MSVNNLLNFFEESIGGGYSTTDDALEISDASRLDTFPYSAVIWDIADKSPVEAYKNNRAEIVNITGKSGDVVDVERGQEGTSAITLEAGRNYAIHVSFTANIADQINTSVAVVTDNEAAINTVADNEININKVADIDTDVTKVADIDTHVPTVANIDTDVSEVSGISEDVTTAASNIQAIIDAPAEAEAASSARDKAEQWANEEEDVPVEDGEFSAKHYKNKAESIAESFDGNLGLTDYLLSGELDEDTMDFEIDEEKTPLILMEK